MKLLILTLLAFATTVRSAETVEPGYADYGQLILTQFVSAPFPHPKRAEGFRYKKDEYFPADKHYSDSTVAIFIPKGFRAGGTVDFVVHFHGWGNHVSSVLRQQQLIEQLIESHRNAVLVVPQGPRDASDSFGGKLEDPGGFKRLMEETLATLRSGVTGRDFLNSETGTIILSGHSGGYRTISFILAQGGLTRQVREVWLFDGLYGQTDKFVNWFEHQPCRFVNIYTERGGTKSETQKLMAELKAKGTDFCARSDVEATPKDLQTQQLIFLFTDLAHNDVVSKRKTFCQFLKTSCLAEIPVNRKR